MRQTISPKLLQKCVHPNILQLHTCRPAGTHDIQPSSKLDRTSPGAALFSQAHTHTHTHTHSHISRKTNLSQCSTANVAPCGIPHGITDFWNAHRFCEWERWFVFLVRDTQNTQARSHTQARTHTRPHAYSSAHVHQKRIHTRMHAHTDTTHTHAHTHTPAHTHTHTHTHTRTHTHAHTHTL